MDTISQTKSGTAVLTYDLAIVGGGVVGLALACALAQQTKLSIVLLEASVDTAPFTPDSYHHRVSAVSLASARILQSLKVWDAVKSERISPFAAIQVWDEKSKANLHFECNEIGEPDLGYIIENNVMQNRLAARLKSFPQVDYISPIKLQSMRHDDDAITLIAEDQREFRVRLAVAADGANSWLRAAAHIGVNASAYDQEAVVATVVTELAHEKTARQVFLATGPLAFLPLNDADTSSIVWSLPHAEAQRLKNIDEETFKAELQQAFASRLGVINEIGKRFTFPLKRQQAENYISTRIALVGDAAHVMHPLAGQGVNLGLLDAASLAEVISDAEKNRKDFASTTVLRRYERWRRADNLALLTGVDIIKHLFASDKVSVQAARSFGMAVTNRFAMLKNIFTRYAVGCRDGLPLLARPQRDRATKTS